MIRNLHEREIVAPVREVGLLIDSLASTDDRLWPRDKWPATCLHGPLGVGVAGGHGPVRYFVSEYVPGRYIEFEFTRPEGFNGRHSFTAIPHEADTTLFRHEIVMSTHATARFTWPLFYRPLHNALIEDCLDLAERDCDNAKGSPTPRSLWTRLLRAPISAQLAKRRARSAGRPTEH